MKDRCFHLSENALEMKGLLWLLFKGFGALEVFGIDGRVVDMEPIVNRAIRLDCLPPIKVFISVLIYFLPCNQSLITVYAWAFGISCHYWSKDPYDGVRYRSHLHEVCRKTCRREGNRGRNNKSWKSSQYEKINNINADVDVEVWKLNELSKKMWQIIALPYGLGPLGFVIVCHGYYG